MNKEGNMKVYEIKPIEEEGGGLISDSLGIISACLGGIEYEEVGNKYILEIKEMAEDEYKNLPEWGGF